ncbi:MAG: putative adenosine monophosphate-protein transferase Fic [Candidatus Methanomethylophilaceae archaeon]|nr:putative adenosine monophosphate-protein transferase Fic [Candidatus Methanomethylophilaceae archaeon]
MLMQQNQYDYEEDGTYCYPGTDVLKNKLNIHDKEILSDAERSISLVRMIELEEHPIRGNYDLGHLKRIHKALFGDIFEWAGQLRTVDISKGTMFCKCEYIESNANKLFRELKDENNLIGLKMEDMASRLAYYLCEINAIHPFREGNGRTQRLFVKQLAFDAGYYLDFTGISDEEMINASVRGFVLDYSYMESLIKRGISKV